VEPHLPVEVAENRLSALLQSLLLAACLGATPLLRLIPTAVLVRPHIPAAPGATRRSGGALSRGGGCARLTGCERGQARAVTLAAERLLACLQGTLSAPAICEGPIDEGRVGVSVM